MHRSHEKSLQFDVDEDFGSLGEIEYPIFAPDKPIEKYHSFRIRNEDDDWVQARMRDRIVNELAAPTHAGRTSIKTSSDLLMVNIGGTTWPANAWTIILHATITGPIQIP